MPTTIETSVTATATTLLRPFSLSPSVELKNRVVMAPMTRSMSDAALVPTEAMADYYGRRAAAGLILTEATIVRADGQGYPNTPGIWSQEQIAGWRRVTEKVHVNGGKIFLQLWHVGRVSHTTFLGGELPIAPSAVPLEGRVPRSEGLQYGTPRAVDLEEIPGLIEAFAQGAENAKEAGFDGVEIHGANGYLIDQFLHHHTNRRDDRYGGSIENLTRFALEIVDAVGQRIGFDRTGIRLSPGAYFNMTGEPRDAEVFHHLLRELEAKSLAYVHVGIFDDQQTFDELDGATASAFLRKHYSGTLIGCGSYSPTTGAEALDSERFDLVAIGRPFIANPDLIDKIESDAELQPYDDSMLLTLV